MKACKHCGDRVRRNQLCSACSAYKRKYDRLPPENVLVLRQRRRDEQRFIRQLTGSR